MKKKTNPILAGILLLLLGLPWFVILSIFLPFIGIPFTLAFVIGVIIVTARQSKA